MVLFVFSIITAILEAIHFSSSNDAIKKQVKFIQLLVIFIVVGYGLAQYL